MANDVTAALLEGAILHRGRSYLARPLRAVVAGGRAMTLSRLVRFAPSYLMVTIRREWQLAILVLGGLAGEWQVLFAWLNLADRRGRRLWSIHGYILVGCCRRFCWNVWD
ncbi:MAG: hypothetical protein R2856_09615 [Caldilineaceae bacterium]